MTTRDLGLLALLAACLPACVPDPSFECVDTPSELASIDAESPLGFTAAQVLAAIEGERALTLTWSDDGPTRYDDPGTSVGATLSVAYAGGAVRYVDSEPSEDGDADIDLECSPRLEIEVELSFVTEDRVFDESLTVTLTAWEVGRVEWLVPAPPGEVEGSLSVDDFVVSEGWTITGGDLRGSFVDGVAEGEYYLGVRDAKSVGYGVLARFTEGP